MASTDWMLAADRLAGTQPLAVMQTRSDEAHLTEPYSEARG